MKKIKASELRTGNIVKYEGLNETAMVCLINGNTHFDCRDELGFFTPNGFYEAIPLTEEWILNLGFEKVNHDFEIYHDFNCYVLHSGFRDNFQMGVKFDATTMYFSWNIKYVHQLQNLFFAICGEELTLKS